MLYSCTLVATVDIKRLTHWVILVVIGTMTFFTAWFLIAAQAAGSVFWLSLQSRT